MQSKTITTYLINGKPNGLRTVFISNKICKALVVPREDIEKIKIRDEATRPSLYFLVSQDNEGHIYIGESENFYERLKNHQTGKDFWDVAISFFSQNNDLTKADVKYLEHLFLKTSNSESLHNKKESTKPHLPEHQQSSVEEFFEDVKLITGFLGYTFFISKFEIKSEDDLSEILYCKRAGTDARGIFKDNIFIVLKGSKIKDKDNNVIELQENKTFKTPSAASGYVVNNASNGWIDWKNQNDKTLDEVLRKNL
jgi:hypothetical protein